MDPRFAQAAAALGLKDADPSMVEQASKFWEMMDDMAVSNPEGYQRFIKKQMDEKKKFDEANKPPEPKFLVQCTDSHSKQVIWINFSESDRVKPQPSQDAPINIVVQEPSTETSEGGKITFYEVVFHPDVMSRFAKESDFKSQAIQLGLDCVEQRAKKLFDAKTKGVHPVQFIRDSLKVRSKPFKRKGMKEVLEEAARKQREGNGEDFDLKMPGSDPKADTTTSAAAKVDVIIPGLTDEKETKRDCVDVDSNDLDSILPKLGVASSKPVIEVVSEQGGGKDNSDGHSVVPVYNLVKNSEDSCFSIRVELPLVNTVGEIDLDVSSTLLKLSVPDVYDLEVELSTAVNPDDTTAKFKKKQHLLLLNLPYV